MLAAFASFLESSPEGTSNNPKRLNNRARSWLCCLFFAGRCGWTSLVLLIFFYKLLVWVFISRYRCQVGAGTSCCMFTHVIVCQQGCSNWLDWWLKRGNNPRSKQKPLKREALPVTETHHKRRKEAQIMSSTIGFRLIWSIHSKHEAHTCSYGRVRASGHNQSRSGFNLGGNSSVLAQKCSQLPTKKHANWFHEWVAYTPPPTRLLTTVDASHLAVLHETTRLHQATYPLHDRLVGVNRIGPNPSSSQVAKNKPIFTHASRSKFYLRNHASKKTLHIIPF